MMKTVSQVVNTEDVRMAWKRKMSEGHGSKITLIFFIPYSLFLLKSSLIFLFSSTNIILVT